MTRIIAAAFGLALMPAIAVAGEKEAAPDQPDQLAGGFLPPRYRMAGCRFAVVTGRSVRG